MSHIQAASLYGEALQLHEAGKHEEAEVLYRRALHLNPKHADALHCLGALLMQLYGAKKFDEAKGLISAAIQVAPSCAKYRNSLGVLYQNTDKFSEAADAFERANEKDPMNIQIMMNLGRALKECGRKGRAAEVYKGVVKLQPNHPKAWYNLSNCLRFLGRTEEALNALRQHLRLHPDDMSTQFWIAALSGDVESMQAMPAELVAGLFDDYADKFDSHLVEALQYRTPQLLLEIIEECGRRQTLLAQMALTHRWRRCVDLGCGTGLMGPLLRPMVRVLEGVDLSPAMVDKARERKQTYDWLAVGELLEYLNTGPPPGSVPILADDSEPYDLLVAADVFVYIGNLQPVLEAAWAKTYSGALFAFSTEALEARGKSAGGASSSASASSAGFLLTPTGRYAHSSSYIRQVAANVGWNVMHLSDSIIRYNGGKPVHGHLVVLDRPARKEEYVPPSSPKRRQGLGDKGIGNISMRPAGGKLTLQAPNA